MENKYITTRWQSLDLLQAGMNSQTADWVYHRYESGLVFTRKRRNKDYFCVNLTPAWSMGRLWDFYVVNGWTYDFSTNLTSEEVIQKLVEGIIKKLKR